MADLRSLAENGWKAYYAHDLDTCLSTYADDAEVILPGGPPIQGKDAIRATWEAYYVAFPDEKPTNIRHLVDGNSVATVWESTATHAGPLPLPTGDMLPPTGKVVQTRGVTVQDFENGLLRRQVFYFDLLAFLQQLGVIPAAEAVAG
jgi:steroid delta-isomerase-like uncharacterized protein